MSRLKRAQFLVGHGWYVFPIVANGKAPATEHGFQDAANYPAPEDPWWKTGNENIGLATGPSRPPCPAWK